LVVLAIGHGGEIFLMKARFLCKEGIAKQTGRRYLIQSQNCLTK